MGNKEQPLLEVKNFSLYFETYEKGLREKKLKIIEDFNLTINEGEIVAILGESGTGKSLLANAVLGLLPKNAKTAGSLIFKGDELTDENLAKLRGKEISLIPQSVNALDPLMKTGKQVQEVIPGNNKKEVQREIFEDIGLSKGASECYPFELSGGMARRVLASTAMVSCASLIVADEPTPGLDPLVLKETIHYLKRLADSGKGIIFITHDIEVALEIADKIAVFHKGETIELTSAENFSGKGEKLIHPYTKALWHAMPKNEFRHLKQVKGRRENGDYIYEKLPLELKEISYRYLDHPWLFRNLSLTINPGEIVGIYGPSGSGKTTLAQIIAGYKQPCEGTIRMNGEAIQRKGRYPVQMVWQHPEKTFNPRWRMHKSLKEAGPIDHSLLKRLGIKDEWLNRWPSELSGGELQRFCLARAIMGYTKYLIADEITTMLDADNQADIWSNLLGVVEDKAIGVLAISHDHKLLERISDRIIHFRDLT